MNEDQIRNIVEAALMVARRPLNVDALLGLFGEEGRPERGQIRDAIASLCELYEQRGIELVEVASGFRIQARQTLSEPLSRLWQERPPRYSRALMETLALIAYRQPMTRGEIEDIRGVSVSSNIVRTLLERGWIRVLGHRDVPGRPAILGTTKEFLDYFGLKKLAELPPLTELQDIDSLNVELDLVSPEGIAEVIGDGGAEPDSETTGPVLVDAPPPGDDPANEAMEQEAVVEATEPNEEDPSVRS